MPNWTWIFRRLSLLSVLSALMTLTSGATAQTATDLPNSRPSEPLFESTTQQASKQQDPESQGPAESQDKWAWWLEAGPELFQWDEFLNGKRELREEGVRYTIASGIGTQTGRGSGGVFSLTGRFTFGQVDYNGTVQWQAEVGGDEIDLVSDAKTQTNYRGFHFVAEGGYRFELSPSHHVELLSGAELDTWSRALQDTSSIDIDSTRARSPEQTQGVSIPEDIAADDYPQGAGGYTETYTLLAARASAGMSHQIFAAWQLDWRIGARYPFIIDEYVSHTGTNLNPQGQLSGFAQTRLSNQHSRWSLRLYFEEYLFDESDWETAGVHRELLVKQPRSESYRAGVTLRYTM